jgi:hypothetical protein
MQKPSDFLTILKGHIKTRSKIALIPILRRLIMQVNG